MEYFKRGKHNPYDAYMMGISIWMSPRQILVLEEKLKTGKDPIDPVDIEAYQDFISQLEHEAKIKKDKYLKEE